MTRLARPIEQTNGLVGDSISHLLQATQGKGGIFLKIHIDLPWGGTFDMDRQPLGLSKFYALCGVVSGTLLVTLFLGIVALR